jgi:hypothetical protein
VEDDSQYTINRSKSIQYYLEEEGLEAQEERLVVLGEELEVEVLMAVAVT